MPRRPFLAVALLLLAAPVSAANDAWSASHTYEAKGDFASAAAVLQRLITTPQPDEFALLRYAWLHYRAGNYTESVRAYERALRINPASLDARLGLVLPLLAQHRWNQAEEVLRQTLKEDPWHYTTHTQLMQVEEALQQWVPLARHARELQRRYPSDATTLVYLARASRALNDHRTARDAYRRVLQRYPAHAEASDWLKQNP